jgi:ribosomal protein S18 acetylase RimI-like enzyme
MKFNHQYLGYESEEQRDLYSCNILDDYGVHVGFCKYYKPLLEFETVYIEFINIICQHRRRGHATAMVKELQRFNNLKWDGRLSVDGRKWYNSLMERQMV